MSAWVLCCGAQVWQQFFGGMVPAGAVDAVHAHAVRSYCSPFARALAVLTRMQAGGYAEAVEEAEREAAAMRSPEVCAGPFCVAC
jgi:hypothetical protein